MYITTRSGTSISRSDMFLGYLCEGCGEPVTVTITVEGKKSGIGGGSTMNAIRGVGASGIRDEKEKAVRDYLDSPTERRFLNINAEGFRSACPFCGHKSIWMHPALCNQETGQVECSIFDSLPDSREWAVKILRERKADAEIACADRRILAEKEYHITTDQMAVSRLEEEKETCPEAETLRALEKQDSMLEKEIKTKGVFSKERTALVKQREELITEISNAKQEKQAAIQRKENQIRLLQRHMILLDKSRKVYADYAIRKESDQCLAYRLAEPGEGEGERVPLLPLPQITDIRLSCLVRENREQIEKALGLSHSEEG